MRGQSLLGAARNDSKGERHHHADHRTITPNAAIFMNSNQLKELIEAAAGSRELASFLTEETQRAGSRGARSLWVAVCRQCAQQLMEMENVPPNYKGALTVMSKAAMLLMSVRQQEELQKKEQFLKQIIQTWQRLHQLLGTTYPPLGEQVKKLLALKLEQFVLVEPQRMAFWLQRLTGIWKTGEHAQQRVQELSNQVNKALHQQQFDQVARLGQEASQSKRQIREQLDGLAEILEDLLRRVEQPSQQDFVTSPSLPPPPMGSGTSDYAPLPASGATPPAAALPYGSSSYADERRSASVSQRMPPSTGHWQDDAFAGQGAEREMSASYLTEPSSSRMGSSQPHYDAASESAPVDSYASAPRESYAYAPTERAQDYGPLPRAPIHQESARAHSQQPAVSSEVDASPPSQRQAPVYDAPYDPAAEEPPARSRQTGERPTQQYHHSSKPPGQSGGRPSAPPVRETAPPDPEPPPPSGDNPSVGAGGKNDELARLLDDIDDYWEVADDTEEEPLPPVLQAKRRARPDQEARPIQAISEERRTNMPPSSQGDSFTDDDRW